MRQHCEVLIVPREESARLSIDQFRSVEKVLERPVQPRPVAGVDPLDDDERWLPDLPHATGHAPLPESYLRYFTA